MHALSPRRAITVLVAFVAVAAASAVLARPAEAVAVATYFGPEWTATGGVSYGTANRHPRQWNREWHPYGYWSDVWYEGGSGWVSSTFNPVEYVGGPGGSWVHAYCRATYQSQYPVTCKTTWPG